MEAIKVGSTRRLNTRRGETGRLWQGRFFDRSLRTVKEYHEFVEYIHGNPVRRGFVARPEDWLWSSVHDYGGMRTKQPQNLLRSEEHTSELQSLAYLVCRLLLEKKKIIINTQ